jgi:hypothetical protein
MQKDRRNDTQKDRWRRHAFAWLAALLLSFAFATGAHARDSQVWVNTNTGVYHCPGGQYYGNTKRGEYLTESEAIGAGYRAAYHRPCSPEIANRARDALIQRLAPADAAAPSPARGSITVWINSGSHVYHCPGTRHYGATKRGRYASEAEAIAAGNRAAYGQRCR